VFNVGIATPDFSAGRGGGGGAVREPHGPDQPPQGSPYSYRLPSQMTPPQAAAVFYSPQYGG
jgi:hypothetical protein